MDDPLASLPPEERDRVYSARELVNLALGGHYCIRDEIDRAIREVHALSGEHGRERMNALPDLRAYATEDEIDVWEAELLQLRDEVQVAARKDRDARESKDQLQLFRAADGAARTGGGGEGA